jgi:hypothetical protein
MSQTNNRRSTPAANPHDETTVLPVVDNPRDTQYPVMGLPGVEDLVAAKQAIANGEHQGTPLFHQLVTQRQGTDFEAFLHDLIHREAPEIMRKAGEYGSNSLAQMGHMFGRMGGRQLNEAEALEMGCFVYAFGKIERIQDAILKGKTPSDDTIKDAWVYLGMMMHIREFKTWP